MSTLTEAEADYAKKDKRLRYGVGALLIYIVLLLTFVAVQTLVTQTTISKNQAANADASRERFNRYTEQNEKQHEITQAYIKCIAQALLVPVEQRQPGAFDKCGVEAQKSVKAAGGSNSASFLAPAASSKSQPVSNSSSAGTVPSNESTATSEQPTTSAPPDPNTPVLDLQGIPLPINVEVGDILKIEN